jgi:hypothetical protein
MIIRDNVRTHPVTIHQLLYERFLQPSIMNRVHYPSYPSVTLIRRLCCHLWMVIRTIRYCTVHKWHKEFLTSVYSAKQASPILFLPFFFLPFLFICLRYFFRCLNLFLSSFLLPLFLCFFLLSPVFVCFTLNFPFFLYCINCRYYL